MRALVTGANGFVGRALCADLAKRGHDVVSITRKEVGEIDRNTKWDGLLAGVDVVFHLAAHVHVLDRVASHDLAEFRRVNVGGTEALAHAAMLARVKRFVFLSTVAVLGTNSGNRAFTEADPLQPETAYGTSKAEAELRLRDFEPMEWTILRAPLVYGPGVEAKFLQLLGIVRRGLPLPFGAITSRRSMMYVANLTDAMIVAAESPHAANETFLISDDVSFSTAELVRQLAASMDRKARLLPVPASLISLGATLLRQRERLAPLITPLVVDSSKFREQTGWKPPVSAEEGLRETVRWYVGRGARQVTGSR